MKTDKEYDEDDRKVSRDAAKELGIPEEELYQIRKASRAFTNEVLKKWSLTEDEQKASDVLGDIIFDELANFYHAAIDTGHLHAERAAAVIAATMERITYTQEKSYEANSKDNGWAEDDQHFGSKREDFEAFKRSTIKKVKDQLGDLMASGNGRPN